MKEEIYGVWKSFHYNHETKDDDIREKLIELLTEMDFTDVKPDWNTMKVIYHDYLYDIDPVGPSFIAIKFNRRNENICPYCGGEKWHMKDEMKGENNDQD